MLDEDAGIAQALVGGRAGSTSTRSSPRSTTATSDAAYEADRRAARSAAGGPAEAQGRAANSDGAVRYTAPSLVFETEDGRRLEAGGFQPLEAYDVCLANLDPTLARRPPATDVAELLAGLRARPDDARGRRSAWPSASIRPTTPRPRTR